MKIIIEFDKNNKREYHLTNIIEEALMLGYLINIKFKHPKFGEHFNITHEKKILNPIYPKRNKK